MHSLRPVPSTITSYSSSMVGRRGSKQRRGEQEVGEGELRGDGGGGRKGNERVVAMEVRSGKEEAIVCQGLHCEGLLEELMGCGGSRRTTTTTIQDGEMESGMAERNQVSCTWLFPFP